ncbi:hypothetical protein BV22DRAFT_1131907 [Leucogyrophana mollusca]|uniref:Uncharacterized protein n=1 Tax=Leucogyrophana mollusca TaxID=85980 RepID=A0ACB8B9H1_9AGAM|nr:hypothetical protein BV22DRAFT_1131907 [Leucogyrophana mollusca]
MHQLITLAQLPIDILYNIFPQLELVDLVRLQQVSKLFLQTIQTRTVWFNAYRTSSLPRPPGPYEWQSTTYLRTTLITSAKADRHWPPHAGSRVPSARTLRIPNRWSATEAPDRRWHDSLRLILLLGRWLVLPVAAGSREEENVISCYDLDAASGRFEELVVYRAPPGVQIFRVRGAAVIAADGPFAFIVFIERSKRGATLKAYRIVGMEWEDLRSKVTFELVLEIPGIPCSDRGSSDVTISPRALVIVNQGETDYRNNTWIMDIRTYRLSRLALPDRAAIYSPQIYLSTTHVVAFLQLKAAECLRVLVEAFPLPTAREGEVEVLYASHRSPWPYEYCAWTGWNTYDSGAVGGSCITLFMREYSLPPSLARLTLTPQPSSSSEPAPIIFDIQAIPFHPSLDELSFDALVSSSGNRRLLTMEHAPQLTEEESCMVGGYTVSVDETRIPDGVVSVAPHDTCVSWTGDAAFSTGDVGPPCDGHDPTNDLLPLGHSVGVGYNRSHFAFDEARGRMVCEGPLGNDSHGELAVRVYDFGA